MSTTTQKSTPKTAEEAHLGGFWPTYKPDQGRIARLFAFWSVGLLAIYGAYRFAPWLRGKEWGWLKTDVPGANNWFDINLLGQGERLPILGFQLTYANMLVFAMLLAFLWWWHRFLTQPSRAELLIDTEAEMNKVTWPTWPETWNSTLVVIGTVVFFMAFLAAADWLLARIVNFLIFS